ncbi:MAG: type II toxin-antitoxin system RelE/ParE family toxin, partial [Elusimicrobia bacterium]|nr:type II toxin-antitoxin system RelE/ParE family toxin [Elusimicrobiota bacterium]
KVYRVELSRQAEKDLERVFRSDKKLYQRFVSALRAIARDPIAEGKPLHGELKGLRAHRLGSYRILYEVRHGELLILVIDLGHRREIYE